MSGRQSQRKSALLTESAPRQSLSGYSQASRRRLANTVKTVAFIGGGVPFVASLTLAIIQYTILSDGLSGLPDTFEKLNEQCNDGTMAAFDQISFCNRMRSLCAQKLTKEYKYVDGKHGEFLTEDAIRCQSAYASFVAEAKSTAYMGPTWILLAGLLFALVVTPLGVLGANKDDYRFTILFTFFNVIGTLAYAVTIAFTCTFMFTVHVAMYGMAAYFGFVLNDRQCKSTDLPAPTFETQVSTPQPARSSTG